MTDTWSCPLPQELAVDLVCFYPAVAEATLRALCLLCLAPAYPAVLAGRAVAVLQHAASASQVGSRWLASAGCVGHPCCALGAWT